MQKKIYLFLLLGVLSLMSCKDSEPALEFSVDPLTLNFSMQETSKEINITYNGGATWSAVASIDWITINEATGTGNKTITVTIPVNDTFRDMNGTITFSAPGIAPIVVTVTQGFQFEEPENINERSSWARMNLKNHPEHVDSYIDYSEGRDELGNLKFNKNGMLTDFVYVDPAFGPMDDFLIEYDAVIPNRIVRVWGSNSAVPFVLRFEYEDHGKYIATEDLFRMLVDLYVPVHNRWWMPRLIKNLKRIVFEKFLPGNGFEDVIVNYEISGNSGTMDFTMNYNGEKMDLGSHILTFNGQYPTQVDYNIQVATNRYHYHHSYYNINPANGKFITYRHYYELSPGGEGEDWMDVTYNDDYRNTNKVVMNFDYTDVREFCTCEYNSNGDLTKFGRWSFSYDYDSHNNWTFANAVWTGSSEVAGEFDREYERSLIYYGDN